MKNKKLLVSLLVGAVLAAGAGVWAVGSGSITIDKVENFNVTISEATGNAIDGLGSLFGGLSNLDILQGNWFGAGPIASTTDAVFSTKILLKTNTASGDNDDFWRNDLLPRQNVWVSVDKVNYFGLATSTMAYYVATSTTSSLTDFTFTKGVPSGTLKQNDVLISKWFATSTIDFVEEATSTQSVLVRPGQYVVLEIINDNYLCQTEGTCSSATSTDLGFDLTVWLDITATGTPPGTN